VNIKGKPRGGPGQLAAHVQKAENESVRIVGIDGLAARDIEGALIEMDAQGAALRTDKTLYHGIISPEPGKDFAMTEADWDFTRQAFLKGMGFEGQPFIEIEHEKFGKDGVLRLHRHIIVGLTDLEHNRAIPTSHNFRKHEEIARYCERELGHEHVQGAHIGRFGVERPERTPTLAEQRAAERGGVSAQEAKTLGAELWNATDSGKALNAALEDHGWMLARGDKMRSDGSAYFMAIDPQGEAHELRRMVPVKAAELYARMADIDAARLPNVSDARDRQQIRAVDLEQRREAAGRSDDIRPDHPARENQAADYFDRDAADDAWIKAVNAAGIKAAPEATQQREASAAPSAPERENTRATEPEREPAPARDAPRVIYLGPPAEFDRAADIVGGLVDGAEKAISAAFDYAADFIAPPPPPTKEQVEQMQKAAEERRQQEPAQREQAEQEARFREILEQIRRDDQRARYDRWTGRRLDGDHDRDRDEDYSRGRERER
jgi:hypothetical protein